MQDQIITGDVRERLGDFPDGSIHMAMTSPPYWNLRDYDHDDQLGLEETSEAYVRNLADVFDEVKRVLRDDGSLWLNLGDTYENKDLQQIPARVALELQDRGWILRNRVTWVKPNPMPQSVKDRLNDTTEAVFHFVKSKEYWYDLDAIREPHEQDDAFSKKRGSITRNGEPGNVCEPKPHPAGKNPGDVFEVTTKPFPDAHFAVYPPELCEKPLKATCPPTVCAECGSPYERDVKREGLTDEEIRTHYPQRDCGVSSDRNDQTKHQINHSERQQLKEKLNKTPEFKGWTPTCDCDTDATEPGIALDPFAGAGTTLLKAKELGRRFVGVELNAEYADMARGRVGLTPNDPSRLRSDANQSGMEAWMD